MPPYIETVIDYCNVVSFMLLCIGVEGASVIDNLAELAYHVRWQLSRSLTTQHLLTVVSITHTLMNQTVGAHSLAASSGTIMYIRGW